MDVLGAAPTTTDSVWIFQGHEGAEHLDPLLAAHRARVTVLRMAQQLLTADVPCYRALVDVVEGGGWAIAIHGRGRTRLGSRRCSSGTTGT